MKTVSNKSKMIEAMIDAFMQSQGLDESQNLKVTDKKLAEETDKILSKLVLETAVSLYEGLDDAMSDVDFQEKNADPSSMSMDHSTEQDDDLTPLDTNESIATFDARSIFEFEEEDEFDWHNLDDDEEEHEHDEENDDGETEEDDYSDLGDDDLHGNGEFHDFEGGDVMGSEPMGGDMGDDDLGIHHVMNNEIGQGEGDEFGGDSEGMPMHDVGLGDDVEDDELSSGGEADEVHGDEDMSDLNDDEDPFDFQFDLDDEEGHEGRHHMEESESGTPLQGFPKSALNTKKTGSENLDSEDEDFDLIPADKSVKSGAANMRLPGAKGGKPGKALVDM